jgi:phage replication-related protein YjqB (UPF0714/DUF867 family)
MTVGIRTFLSEDSTSAPLNTEAHAVEHCAVDAESLGALGSAVGRQLLIRQASNRLALYTVAERLSVPARAVHLGTAGLARLGAATPAPHAQKANATIETDFTDGDPEAVARLSEELLGEEDATGLAILAPHGGRIEVGTDDQAELVHDMLALNAKPVRGWIARGFNRATGAHTCWHITSSEISEHSFPKLGSLLGPAGVNGPFAHAVAFHGNNDSEAVVVGGGLPRNDAHTALKTSLASQIHSALEAVMDEPPAVEVKRSGPLAGSQRHNIVNRVTVRGNGIQVEQPLAVRDHVPQREAIARAVAELYLGLI